MMDIAINKSKRRLLLVLSTALFLLLLLFVLSTKSPRRQRKDRVYVLAVDPATIYSAVQLDTHVKLIRSQRVKSVVKSGLGSWARDHNLLATMQNGKIVFMKNRRYIQLQAELFSFYLNAYLGLWNVPPVTLSCVNAMRRPWSDILFDTEILPPEEVCVMAIEYMHGLVDAVYMSYHVGQELNGNSFPANFKELDQVMQWSDLILFDYISAHTDRLVDNLLFYPLNFQLTMKMVPNLMMTSDGLFVLIDNEATFHRSYYKAQNSYKEKYRQTHHLENLSIFREATIVKLCQLCEHDDPASVLENFISKHDAESLKIAGELAVEDRLELKKRLSDVCAIICMYVH